jgi:hypothetical protein
MVRYARAFETNLRHVGELDDLQRLLLRQRGVISRRQALRFLTGSAIRHRLESGAWQVAARAVYVTHSGPVTPEQRLVVAALAAGSGRPAVLAGLTALNILGMRGNRARTVQVLLPWQRRDFDPPSWVEVHRTRHLPAAEYDRRTTPPYTLAARSLIDAAQWATTDDDAAAIIAAGYQQRLVAGDDVGAALARMPRVRRRRLIGEVAADAAGGSHSLPEVEFLRGCRQARLPAPDRQVVRRDRSGRRRYLDAHFTGYGVHVEIDGGQHLDVRNWWADMRRQNDLWVAGDVLLRFPAYVIRRRPSEWVPQLRAALVAGGWTPTMAGSPRSSRAREHRC